MRKRGAGSSLVESTHLRYSMSATRYIVIPRGKTTLRNALCDLITFFKAVNLEWESELVSVYVLVRVRILTDLPQIWCKFTAGYSTYTRSCMAYFHRFKCIKQ